jgi:hypothetical protein
MRCGSFVALLVLASLPAHANTVVNSNCPTIAHGHKWSTYFSHGYPGGAPAGILAGFVFDRAKALKDKSVIGNNPIDGCYLVHYQPQPSQQGPKGWSSMHHPQDPFYTPGRPSGADYERFRAVTQSIDGMPGDPALRQISIGGTQFTFNDKTGVVSRKGYEVGQLLCYLPSASRC